MQRAILLITMTGMVCAGILIGMYLNAAPGSEVQPTAEKIVFACVMLGINVAAVASIQN